MQRKPVRRIKSESRYDSRREQNILLESIDKQVKTVAEGHIGLARNIDDIKSTLNEHEVRFDRIESAVTENSRSVKRLEISHDELKADVRNLKTGQEEIKQKLDVVTVGHEQRIQKLEAAG